MRVRADIAALIDEGHTDASIARRMMRALIPWLVTAAGIAAVITTACLIH